ncbi:hypothetical protein [Demequina sp.]|uniref:hypothetical protein n=1 Tax=Demequina sp. TaxID=2050685 RepID=UPI0025CDCFB8|nr:hypothetical protein [Demequina sp.]
MPLPDTRSPLWRGDGTSQAALSVVAAPGPALTGLAIRVRGLTATGVCAAEAATRAGATRLSLVDDAWSDAEDHALPPAARGSRARRTARLVGELRPDLTLDLDTTRAVDGEIVVAFGSVAPPVAHLLAVEDRPHVAVLVDESGALVLPVVPGESACLRCRDVALTQADPAWPVLARQCEARAPVTDPLCAAVAGALAAASLAVLLGGGRALAWRVEGGLPSRAAVAAHEACGCEAARRSAA